MSESADCGPVGCMRRLDEIFDRKTGPTQTAKKFFPAVQEFECARLAIGLPTTSGNGPVR